MTEESNQGYGLYIRSVIFLFICWCRQHLLVMNNGCSYGSYTQNSGSFDFHALSKQASVFRFCLEHLKFSYDLGW